MRGEGANSEATEEEEADETRCLWPWRRGVVGLVVTPRCCGSFSYSSEGSRRLWGGEEGWAARPREDRQGWRAGEGGGRSRSSAEREEAEDRRECRRGEVIPAEEEVAECERSESCRWRRAW